MYGRTNELAMSIPSAWIEKGKMAALAAARQQWLEKDAFRRLSYVVFVLHHLPERHSARAFGTFHVRVAAVWRDGIICHVTRHKRRRDDNHCWKSARQRCE